MDGQFRLAPLKARYPAGSPDPSDSRLASKERKPNRLRFRARAASTGSGAAPCAATGLLRRQAD